MRPSLWGAQSFQRAFANSFSLYPPRTRPPIHPIRRSFCVQQRLCVAVGTCCILRGGGLSALPGLCRRASAGRAGLCRPLPCTPRVPRRRHGAAAFLSRAVAGPTPGALFAPTKVQHCNYSVNPHCPEYGQVLIKRCRSTASITPPDS